MLNIATIGELTNNFIITGAALVLLFAALFVSIKFFITDRLSRITKHFAVASEDDFAYIKPVHEDNSNDEISLLARSFNNLARKLMNTYLSSLDDEIEERKTAEKKLLESKQTLENVLESSGPICITNTDFEIILANKEPVLEASQELESGR